MRHSERGDRQTPCYAQPLVQSIPVLRSTAFHPVLDFLEANSLPVESHFAAVGAPQGSLEELDRLVPERPFWALMGRLRQREGIEDIGFRLGASHRVIDLPNIEPLVTGHATLQRTVEAFCGLLDSHNNAWDFWVEEIPEGLRLCRRSSVFELGAWPLEQYGLSYMVDLIRMAAPSDWWPREIWLQFGGPLVPVERQWLGEARLHFDGPVTAIVIPHALLSKRPHDRGRSRPATFGTEPIDQDFVSVFREILRTGLLEGRPLLPQIASQLGVQSRTLQRSLAKSGTGHRALLEEIRLEMACTRLEDGLEPISEIARDLGYRHVPALSQSFRRWTGVSPSTYRKANRRSVH